MAAALACTGAVYRVGLKRERRPALSSPRMRETGRGRSRVPISTPALSPQTLSADLDPSYPPAVTRQHAVTDEIAAVVIVVRIVVVIGVGSDTESHEGAVVKPMVK